MRINFFVALVAILSLTQSYAQNNKRVILIGSDGLSAQVIRENPELFPNIMNLYSQGSGTLESRSVLPSSSAVNWASHLMGAGPELHGYNTWGSKKPDLLSRVVTENGTFPCVFHSVRQTYPNDLLGCVYSWDGIGYLFDTAAVDLNCFVKTDREVTDKSIEFIKKNPRFAFFYLAEPDHSGHQFGWMSNEYKQSCAQIDSYVGELVEAVKQNMPEATIIFISDHGGIEKGHGKTSMSEMQVPFVIFGEGFKKGYKTKGSQMVFDTAPTITNILGCENPQVWIGRPVLEGFESPTNNLFTINLDENPTTGYQWSVAKSENVSLVSQDYLLKHPEMIGSGGVKRLTFKVDGQSSKKITGKVTMQYKRAWEAKPINTKSFTFIAQ